jgi:hypothetical protein
LRLRLEPIRRLPRAPPALRLPRPPLWALAQAISNEG